MNCGVFILFLVLNCKVIMENFKTRKIEYYSLVKKNYREIDTPITPFTEVISLLKSISQLSKKKRIYDLKSDKYCLLDVLDIVNDDNNDIFIVSGMFKSAISNFRPKLINRRTAAERDNPKEKVEGEIERTHFCLKIYNTEDYKDVLLLVEKNTNGVSACQFVNYLNHYNKKFAKQNNQKVRYSIKYSIIARDDIDDAIKNLARTKIAELHVDKQILGSDALNFSNRIHCAQKDIVITVKAERKNSISDIALDILKLFKIADTKVTRLRVWGETCDKQNILIDTSLFSKKTEIKCELNPETGEVSTAKIVSQMKNIINDL